MSEKEGDALDIEMEKKEHGPVLPVAQPAVAAQSTAKEQKSSIHPAVYIAIWIALSSSVILFNKAILYRMNFKYPIILTTWHLLFATFMTQTLARFTTVLDSRKKVPMTGKVYLRAIMPIGVMFSLSLICNNITFVYLTVSFMQMLKATTPVAVLLISWSMRISPPSLKTLGNVTIIVVGVAIASYGEMAFVPVGVFFQLTGIAFEATRLVMVQRLLSSAEFKMDPLVSLYYFAPVCAIMNAMVAFAVEFPRFHFEDVARVGYLVLLSNALVAFMLNVAVVFLIGKTSSLAMTLSGVLKDILLVAISYLFYSEEVTVLQVGGYSIALAGLVYYRVGGEKLKEHTAQAQRAWQDYRIRKPAASRALAVGVVLATLVVMLFGIHASGIVPKDVTQMAQDKWNQYLNNNDGE